MSLSRPLSERACLHRHCCVFLLLMSEPVRNVQMRNQTLTMFAINPLVHIYEENDRRTNLQASLHSQLETRKLQQVCCRPVTLLSSS